jgi:hypothetical protein
MKMVTWFTWFGCGLWELGQDVSIYICIIIRQEAYVYGLFFFYLEGKEYEVLPTPSEKDVRALWRAQALRASNSFLGEPQWL